MMRFLNQKGLVVLLTWGLAPLAWGATATFTNADCFACHDDPGLVRVVAASTNSLCVKTNALAKSVHSALACTDCHAGIKDLPHPDKLPPPQCGTCHDDS
ncbi:MAG: hypothetical protein WCL49_12340, partial [bacterium]